MPKNWRTRLGAILGSDRPDREDEQSERADVDAQTPSDIPGAIAAGVFQQIEPVLVVDDDLDWGKECAFSLRQMGYEPFVASRADEALGLFVNHDISVAIVDYNLPGLDGISLMRELAQRAEAEGRQLRLIMATGHAARASAIDAMRAAAIDCLQKPICPADLRGALQRIRETPPAPGESRILLDKISRLGAELQKLDRLPLAPGDPIEPQHLICFIRDQLRRETKRREIGGGGLFGDPAWAMLLDLLLAKLEGRRVSVSSACIASGAPMSTALRLVRRLVDEGVLRRVPDERDRRRHFLAINPTFELPLVDYLSEQVRQRS